ncbi:UDP-3-O-(3-hydroxymyristoyl) glucosamine N-acyltransferase [Thiomicrospira aerophila AL3]|uniref:UDP-3-O-acyl-N-acetylglucosamine deacetylase n=1 Tax=Thiomicrospira aerophila AL3 TaxID=717772 RepID=W0DPM0_9GAMM|nr:UDP-3-O-acyl-N-acetylglucosamine deacetylase [Thiomicrospira aerophila]AHF00560.1 UDP-3-O-(3-hydroxymyristoyl) glucosamine N-acyltransferase [Thiomicrospira aerophila AL3]
MKQRTLANPIHAKGIGLHTGHQARITLRPAPVDTGIVFRRVDVQPAIEFKVTPDLVAETTLCTTIRAGGEKIATIEHLMSALAGVGMDNVYIDIDADEVPIMDGSASHFIFLIQAAGIKLQDKSKQFLVIKKPVRVENELGGWAEFKPYNGYKLNFAIKFNHPAFKQTAEDMTLEFSSTSYFKEVSRARTFGFYNDMEALRAKKLALGASLDNAIGLDENGVMNKGGLRNKDEFVRHKILDAVGDLFMSGYAIVGEFSAFKSGHALNNQLLRKLFAQPDTFEFMSEFGDQAEPINFDSSKVLV